MSRHIDDDISLQAKLAIAEQTVASLKSLISDINHRAYQAEQLNQELMNQLEGAVGDEGMRKLVGMIAQHIDQRATERAVQQQSLIQSTLVALSAVLGSTEGDVVNKESIVAVHRNLSAAVNTMV